MLTEEYKPELRDILHSESQTFPPMESLLLLIMFVIIVAAELMLGQITGTTFFSMDAMKSQYWFFIAVLTVICIGITVLVGWMLATRNRHYRAIGYPYEQDDVVWSSHQCFKTIVITLLSGFLTGLLGIPNSLLEPSAFVLLGSRPEVAMATSNLLMVLTSIATFIMYANVGLVGYSYGTWYTVWAAVGALLGVIGLETLMKKHGKPSIAGYYLAFTLLIHLVIVIGYRSFI